VPVAEGRPIEHLDVSQTDAFVSASKLPGAGVQRTYLNLYEKAKRLGGDPGRNILLKGAATGDGRVRSATKFELRRSIGVLKRMTAPPAAGTSVAGAAPSAELEAIAACESGGDPSAVGGGGLYRGKYQFTYETWASVGGSGDPAAAPEAEQDARAAALLARDGAGHWPNCGG
jgi:Transglycosylase-like domain